GEAWPAPGCRAICGRTGHPRGSTPARLSGIGSTLSTLTPTSRDGHPNTTPAKRTHRRRSTVELKSTTRTHEALTAAAQSAVELGNPKISAMHLLWALAGQVDGIARAALEAVGVDPLDVIRRAEQAIDSLPRVSGGGAESSPTFVGTGYDALEAARHEADAA